MQIVIPFLFFAKVFVYKRESFKLVAGWFSNYGPPLSKVSLKIRPQKWGQSDANISI